MTPSLPPPSARPQRIAQGVVCAALVLLGLYVVHGFLPALGWAGILAIATWPLYERAEQRLPARAHLLLPALATLGVAVLFLLPLGIAALQLGREAGDALRWLREVQAHGAAVPDWLVAMPVLGSQAAAWWTETLAAPQAAAAFLRRLAGGELLGLGRRFGGALAHRVVLFGFTLLALFFLFRDGRALVGQLRLVADRLFGVGSERVARQVIASVRGTVSGLVLVGLGQGALLGVAYAVAGVPHPVLLGALTGLAAMIPFAAPLVFGAAALLLAAQGAVAAAAGVFGWGMLVLFVADHAVRPALIGGATRLPFLWVLLGILGGVEGFGLLGLFLGPAIMAVLVLLWREAAAATPEAGPVAGPPSPPLTPALPVPDHARLGPKRTS